MNRLLSIVAVAVSLMMAGSVLAPVDCGISAGTAKARCQPMENESCGCGDCQCAVNSAPSDRTKESPAPAPISQPTQDLKWLAAAAHAHLVFSARALGRLADGRFEFHRFSSPPLFLLNSAFLL